MPPQSAARSRVTVQSGRERSRGGASGGEASLTGMRASQDADRRLVRRPALRLPSPSCEGDCQNPGRATRRGND